ncbi:MAG: CPBP family intramembrane metalloprotease, partial [Lactococcus sp.]
SQGAVATVGQMIQVSGMGMLLAALYVRYGTLLMPIFVHFMIDFLVTLIHGPYPSKLNGVSDETTLIIVSVIWAGIYVAISMWLLWHCHDKEGFMARLAGQAIK